MLIAWPAAVLAEVGAGDQVARAETPDRQCGERTRLWDGHEGQAVRRVDRSSTPLPGPVSDQASHSGLLCRGGGTGIAPIKALVEDVAEHGDRRPVEVFYGARTDRDLYDIDTMMRLQKTCPWLAVGPVVSTGPGTAGGPKGLLPEAVRAYGPWHECDACLSGPPGVIRSSVDVLRGIGMPAERIRHDAVEELVATAPPDPRSSSPPATPHERQPVSPGQGHASLVRPRYCRPGSAAATVARDEPRRSPSG
ncbi:hypothetical protein ACFWOJ_05360 [Streptomyces sp. NPDC058439]|uniref:hypothetical protein n=1 Tax=Streptomyces sp. NPDC058439 TaxID=3346500 RepID=UPI00365D0E33